MSWSNLKQTITNDSESPYIVREAGGFFYIDFMTKDGRAVRARILGEDQWATRQEAEAVAEKAYWRGVKAGFL